MKLEPMVEFVLQQKETIEFNMNDTVFETGKLIQKFFKYAKFLRQNLTVGMFVPVDKHGVVLGPLQFCCNSSDCGCLGMPVNVSCQEEIDEYYEAEDNVLFEGFVVRSVDNGKFYYIYKGSKFILSLPLITADRMRVIEDLIPYEVDLSHSAIKQFS